MRPPRGGSRLNGIKLEDLLGTPVIETVASEGVGIALGDCGSGQALKPLTLPNYRRFFADASAIWQGYGR